MTDIKREALERIVRDCMVNATRDPDKAVCQWCGEGVLHDDECPVSIARAALAEMESEEPVRWMVEAQRDDGEGWRFCLGYLPTLKEAEDVAQQWRDRKHEAFITPLYASPQPQGEAIEGKLYGTTGDNLIVIEVEDVVLPPHGVDVGTRAVLTFTDTDTISSQMVDESGEFHEGESR